MSITRYDSYTEARAHLKDLFDAAERGQAATVRRDAARTAVVEVERLRSSHASLSAHCAEVDGWSVFTPDLPIAAGRATFDEAIAEMIVALREYAEDWQERLLDAPNHRKTGGLVQLISLSDDDQLRDWWSDPVNELAAAHPPGPRDVLLGRGRLSMP